MTTLILVRHGQSETNPYGIFTGQLDVQLLELGVIQAEKTAEFIAENYKVDKVYASDLKRAYLTGEIIAGKVGAKIIADKRFRELDAGIWQGMKYDEIGEKYPDAWGKWLNDIGNCRTGKESIKEMGDRVCEGLCEIAEENEGKTVVIATHATPIRVATCLLGGNKLLYFLLILIALKNICEYSAKVLLNLHLLLRAIIQVSIKIHQSAIFISGKLSKLSVSVQMDVSITIKCVHSRII